MEPLRLKPRQPVEAEVENWDDEDFIVDGDELSLRPTSTAVTTNAQPRRRDSTSSHISLRSDLDSLHGEEQHVHLPADDERSTMAAIAAAERAGIPLPKNVPSSALTGGTIKRLGGKKGRRIIDEDWENDLELPEGHQSFQMKPRTQADFPETLRKVSAGSMQNSPRKTTKSARDSRRSSIMSTSSTLSAALSLDKFRDTEDEDDDFFGDGLDTIKVAKSRPPRLMPFITPPTPVGPELSTEPLDDDFERDLELPSDGKLKLSARRDIPKAPFSLSEDIDWGEGSSLGTRYGGTRRDARSTRSSSVSAMSPSLSSTFTVESEDETFDGLVLPPGHLNFQERLHLRKTNPPPEDIPEEPPAEAAAAPPKKRLPAAEVEQQDFMEGLELGDGNVFDSGKLTMHRNIKIKDSRLANPARPKAAVSLTFSNKPVPPQTRIPRLNHERSHSTALEPVSESGGPITHRVRRPQSRVGHSNQLSVTSLPTPTTISTFSAAPAPRRAELSRPPFSVRNEPPTTNAQLLRQKRSLAAVRARNPTAKPLAGRLERPSSRTETRPKTPQERQQSISGSPGQRKSSIPFLPAGASHLQSQHAASKTVRPFRRFDSDNTIETRPISRTLGRPGLRSPSPHRYKVAADTWERLSRPKGKRNFGDGHELDAFDDLPTSKETECRFLKQPSASNPNKRRAYQVPPPSQPPPVDRNKTPSPWKAAPGPAIRSTYTPSFARDTAASRIARETALAHRTPSGGPLASVSAQRAPTRSNTQQPSHLAQNTNRTRRPKRPQQLKPHLIANLNGGKESKVVKGMFYNAETFCWEGNENALNAFDGSNSTPSSNSVPPHLIRDKEAPAPRPALITNISGTKGVQVVGGMVFDPQNMCWLKLGPQNMTASEATDSLDNFTGFEEEDDVFKDIPDLEDTTVTDEREGGQASDIKDDWLVGEEFDVGPEFIRRQREEEERWRKKCEKWTNHSPRDQGAWRWTIRELVSQFDDFAVPSIAR